jgi:multidrug efflux pump
MILSDTSVRRPVLATVMSLLIIVLGLISYSRLTVREYPNIDSPVVSVRTVYPGASAEIMESQVTRVLEDSLAGIEGIRVMKSSSREEVSEITVEFLLERDPDAAANDVRDRVARVRGLLPEDADEPVVSKVEADAQAVIWLAFGSERHSHLEITDYADRFVVDRLQALPGVASVIIGGERRYAMRLWVDRDRLAAYALTPQDVEDALRRQNLEVPAGRIESREREFTLLAETDLRSPEQFEDLIIRYINGYPIRLKDVGRAELGAEDERRVVRFMGEPAVGLGVVKQSTANTLDVARAVKDAVPDIARSLPDGMQVKVAFDTSVFVEESIRSVYATLGEALLLVVLVIFVFLRSLRATLIPSVAIPVSLIGAFIFMFAMGFSVNILTLLALVLAIGLVVDDAIVVLENVYRRIEDGMPAVQAALEGSREIAFAVVAMTVSMATVFVPLAFMTGNTGRLFTEFALAVSGAVLVSGFVALTLTPMLCSRILAHRPRHGAFYRFTERGFTALRSGYESSLRLALKGRWLVLLLGVASAVGGYVLFTQLKAELSPLEDRGFILSFMLAPEGSTLEYTDRYARQAEAFIRQVPEVRQYFMVVAPGLQAPNPVTTAIAFVSLKPWSERQRSQQAIAASLMPSFFSLPGVFAFPVNPPSLGQSFRDPPVQFVIQGDTYEQLREAVDRMMEKGRGYPGLANLDSDLRLDKPQIAVRLDRDKVADVGVDVDTVGRTLETLFAGRKVTRFKRYGEQYDVIVQLESKDRSRPDDLTSVYVRNRDQQLVQLSNLVGLREQVAPKELNHFNRLRSAKLSANVAPGYALGDALGFLEGAAAQVLPATAQTSLDGQSREFRESANTLYVTFGLALVFIYLVLAAQFESFIDPLMILLSVPLAIAGALLSLWLTGGTMNVYSQIGMVMLVGLTAKNAILIIDFANHRREQGLGVREAVIEAAALRLRPILMTSLTMVLAALPLALAQGAGAESRQQIGWVIFGGLIVGTLLSLYVVPAIYTLLSGRRHRLVALEVAQPA